MGREHASDASVENTGEDRNRPRVRAFRSGNRYLVEIGGLGAYPLAEARSLGRRIIRAAHDAEHEAIQDAKRSYDEWRRS